MGTEVRLRQTLVADVTDIGGSEASLRSPKRWHGYNKLIFKINDGMCDTHQLLVKSTSSPLLIV